MTTSFASCCLDVKSSQIRSFFFIDDKIVPELSSKIEKQRQEKWSKIGFPGLCILENNTRQISIYHPSFEPKQTRKCPKASLHPLVTDFAIASMALWGR